MFFIINHSLKLFLAVNNSSFRVWTGYFMISMVYMNPFLMHKSFHIVIKEKIKFGSKASGLYITRPFAKKIKRPRSLICDIVNYFSNADLWIDFWHWALLARALKNTDFSHFLVVYIFFSYSNGLRKLIVTAPHYFQLLFFRPGLRK